MLKTDESRQKMRLRKAAGEVGNSERPLAESSSTRLDVRRAER